MSMQDLDQDEAGKGGIYKTTEGLQNTVMSKSFDSIQ